MVLLTVIVMSKKNLRMYFGVVEIITGEKMFKERREGIKNFILLYSMTQGLHFSMFLELTLFFCFNLENFRFIRYRGGLVLGEKKCSSSSLALTLEYYIKLS